VDGGVVDNLPIDVMAARFEGAIVASDVNLYGEVARPQRALGAVGRLAEMARWLNPSQSGRAGFSPEIFEILMRSSLAGSQRTTLTSLARGDASLYLRLPLARFGLLDWSAHDELFAAGYEFARQELAPWAPPWRQTVRARGKD
jgi:predicted acylesterase/phospholipase RssA